MNEILCSVCRLPGSDDNRVTVYYDAVPPQAICEQCFNEDDDDLGALLDIAEEDR